MLPTSSVVLDMPLKTSVSQSSSCNWEYKILGCSWVYKTVHCLIFFFFFFFFLWGGGGRGVVERERERKNMLVLDNVCEYLLCMHLWKFYGNLIVSKNRKSIKNALVKR